MTRQLTRIALTALALAGFAGSAQAALIAEAYATCGPTEGCQGSTIYLSVDDDGGSGDFLVTYRINTDTYTGGEIGLNQVGFTAITGWTGGTVLSSPVGSLTDWNPVIESPISANSLCDHTNGNSDKVCVAGFVNTQGGGEYTWTFLIEGGTVRTDTSEWHIGGQWADGFYRTSGPVISSDAAGEQAVPEPTAAVLFGLGALLITRSVQRR
jgi:hypothetical protein